MTAAPAVLTRRCNPYGHATDAGPRHLLGGLYGPEYEGANKWVCENAATLRVRMTCRCGHRGQVMELCLPHAKEIQRRQSDLCPPCSTPPVARGVMEAMKAIENEIILTARQDSGLIPGKRARFLNKQMEHHQQQMNELMAAGVIHKCALTLEEIS